MLQTESAELREYQTRLAEALATLSIEDRARVAEAVAISGIDLRSVNRRPAIEVTRSIVACLHIIEAVHVETAASDAQWALLDAEQSVVPGDDNVLSPTWDPFA